MTDRELDALVAEKIIGVRNEPVPPYATDIAAAWMVVETIRGAIYLERDHTSWLVLIDARYEATAATASRAICLAALKAVGALPTDEDLSFLS
jgi:hypothetical protein